MSKFGFRYEVERVPAVTYIKIWRADKYWVSPVPLSTHLRLSEDYIKFVESLVTEKPCDWEELNKLYASYNETKENS